jgi:hypothetical protein
MAKDCQGINAEWQQIKDSVLNAATGLIQNGKTRNPGTNGGMMNVGMQWKSKIQPE